MRTSAVTAIIAAIAGLVWGEVSSTALSNTIIWSIGTENGKPAAPGGALVAGEFRKLRATAPVTTVRTPADVPQDLAAGQSLVFHLGEVPYTDLILRLALATTPDPQGAFGPATDRRVRVKFNDRIIWNRWFAEGHARLAAYVPPTYVERGDNLLVIENCGSESLAFDAISLGVHIPGPSLLVALTGAERLAGSVAADVAQTVLRLGLPEGTGKGSAQEEQVPHRQAPQDVAAAIGFWREMVARPVPDGEDAATRKTRVAWDRAITAALRRGLLPVVELQPAPGTGASEVGWAANRYGGAVAAWLTRPLMPIPVLRDNIGGARVLSLYRQGIPTEADAVFLYAAAGAFGGRIDRVAGRFRADDCWSKGHPAPPLGLWTQSPTLLGDVREQRRNGQHVAQTMVQWLMSGGDALVVAGGEAGSDFFPDLPGLPSSAWEAVRLVFALGEGTPRGMVCTVVPERLDDALADTCWAASENEPDCITAVLMPTPKDTDKPVRLIMPAPGAGASAENIRTLFPTVQSGAVSTMSSILVEIEVAR